MTIFFQDGFESGDLTAWSASAGVPAVENLHPYQGTYNLIIPNLAVAGDFGSVYYNFPAHKTDVYMRALIYLTQLPTSGTMENLGPGCRIVAAGWQVVMGIQKVGADYYWALNQFEGAKTVHLEALPSNPVAGKWYNVEVRDKIDAVNGILDLWVDGVSKIHLTGENTDQRGTGDTESSFVTAYLDADEAPAITEYVDAVVFSDEYNGFPSFAALGLTNGMVFHGVP